ncbi:MptD family putative ECF transporter S component [Corynebacterium felinum]|uniref:Energy-coupling factor transport system substrate-specific component n=1 Tax=Corynebacterium felinum TaxID=131318 RepID=A0ABU2BA21_9CORY|nr:MptD family putative ECF transporter S component [Corynebacterium felinum]MDF5820725.1 MptD family putative ECF transporter S component [Corynebacterium felinum]MDR7354229.1 energy-coupling factor transport system substrate-specific component [Corynebacterium felinum]WJY96398.1 hypothetical protein CFELI_14135 [Corynebacterium felinum]
MALPITKPKSLILAGVFSCVYFVAVFGSGMLGIIAPVMMLVGWVIGITINGIVVMLYIAKVPHVGAFTILGALVGLGMTLTGHVWYTMLLSTPIGLVADLVARTGSYRRPLANAAAYGVFNQWFIVPLLPILYNADEYFQYVAESMNSVDYAEKMRALFSPTLIFSWTIVVFIVSFITAMLGMKMLRTHFERAGVV